MFYRFKSKLASQDRLQLFMMESDKPGTTEMLPAVKHYEVHSQLLGELLAQSGMNLYQAPVYTDNVGISAIFHPGKEHEIIPDIWGTENFLICSQRFKTVVEANDNFPCEFFPLAIFNSELQQLTTDQPYFWFHPRRFVAVPIGEEKTQNLPFIPIHEEAQLFYQLQQHPQWMAALAQLPLWRFLSSEPQQNRDQCGLKIVYFSAAFVQQLQQAQISGLDLFSRFDGTGEESLVEVNTQWGDKPCFIA